MGRKDQIWWVSATVMSLAAFSFFAGLGLRGLYERLAGRAPNGALSGYPQVASTAQRVDGLKPMQLYWDVLNKLRLYYVETPPSGSVLAYGSVDAMLSSLGDPNTRTLSQMEVEAIRSAGEGVFPGLGAVLTITRQAQDGEELAEEPVGPVVRGSKPAPPRAAPGVRTITVVAVVPGSPAAKAGLEPGDRITEVDGRWVAPAHVSYRLLTQITDDLGPQDGRPRDPEEPADNRPPDPAREKARQEADKIRSRWKSALELPNTLPMLLTNDGKEHELTVERGRPAKTLKVKVTLGETRAELVSSRKVNDTTGYLRILAFSENARRQAADALAGFKQSGLKNLVLDLRESPGGSLEAARDVAGMLLGETKIGVARERGPAEKKVDRPVNSRGAAVFKPVALTVLVDGGTAGSSELLAAALRDVAGAKLIGDTTFGDGSEQEVVPLENGTGVSITRARLLTAKGVEWDGKGLKPDAAAGPDPVESAVKLLGSVPARVGGGA
jgi:carboxyl-terminal processing protease